MRIHRDPGSRPLAHHRQRVGGCRPNRSRLREAIRLTLFGRVQPAGVDKLGEPAGVVKLVYTQDLGSCAFEREGSSPFSRTL